MSDSSLRTIALTDKPPLKIREDEWPVVAAASGDSSGGSYNYEQHQRARERGELERYTLVVRKHADGRALVYGSLKPKDGFSFTDPRQGGELLDPEADLVAAIRRVGEHCQLPERVINACISTATAIKR